jgi:ribosome biogenesis GTPase
MLTALGWDDDWAEAARAADPGATPGRVARLDKGRATVVTGGDTLRVDSGGSEIAVGDWVLLRGETIAHVLPRRSAFVRAKTIEGRTVGPQVVAANVDVVLVVHALTNGPNVRRLERELVLAHESGATPLVVLNKCDAAGETRQAEAVAEVARVAHDTEIVVTSAKTGAGIGRLREIARAGRTIAFIGPSGVGKSTLVNAITGSDVQTTSDVREGDQRGRHTTTARELVLIPGGGLLVDTPGLRAVALWDADEGLMRTFPDVEVLAGQCKFNDCAHDREPGCAVRAAIARGALDPDRFAHYQRLSAELDEAEKVRRAR